MPSMPTIMITLGLLFWSYYAYYEYYYDHIMRIPLIMLCLLCRLWWPYDAYYYDRVTPIMHIIIMIILCLLCIILWSNYAYYYERAMPSIMIRVCVLLWSYYAYYYGHIMRIMMIMLCLGCLLLWPYSAYYYDHVERRMLSLCLDAMYHYTATATTKRASNAVVRLTRTSNAPPPDWTTIPHAGGLSYLKGAQGSTLRVDTKQLQQNRRVSKHPHRHTKHREMWRPSHNAANDRSRRLYTRLSPHWCMWGQTKAHKQEQNDTTKNGIARHGGIPNILPRLA